MVSRHYVQPFEALQGTVGDVKSTVEVVQSFVGAVFLAVVEATALHPATRSACRGSGAIGLRRRDGAFNFIALRYPVSPPSGVGRLRMPIGSSSLKVNGLGASALRYPMPAPYPTSKCAESAHIWDGPTTGVARLLTVTASSSLGER